MAYEVTRGEVALNVLDPIQRSCRGSLTISAARYEAGAYVAASTVDEHVLVSRCRSDNVPHTATR